MSAQKKAAYYKSIQTEKIDTLRWSIAHGGFHPCVTQNNEGHTGIQIACAKNKIRALETILDHLRRLREPESINNTNDDGMTPLMMAAANGNDKIVRLLMDAKANVNLKSDDGFTARDYAVKRKQDKVIAALNGEPDEEMLKADDKKSKNKDMGADFSALSVRALRAKGLIQGRKDDKEEEEEAVERPPCPKARWPEVREALKSERCDLNIEMADDDGRMITPESPVDPALWYCTNVNRLQLTLPGAVLTAIPDDLQYLSSMLTLILSNNGLTSLPDVFNKLPLLKNFEAQGNQLTCLPPTFGKLKALELLNLKDNKLTDISSLRKLKNLVTVSLDNNELENLEGLTFKKLQRLRTLSATHNQITVLDESVGELALLENLKLEHNKMEEVPCELSGLLKKLQVLELTDNPIKDPKVMKNLKKATAGGRDLKEVLKFFAKNAKKGGKKKKGKKK